VTSTESNDFVAPDSDIGTTNVSQASSQCSDIARLRPDRAMQWLCCPALRSSIFPSLMSISIVRSRLNCLDPSHIWSEPNCSCPCATLASFTPQFSNRVLFLSSQFELRLAVEDLELFVTIVVEITAVGGANPKTAPFNTSTVTSTQSSGKKLIFSLDLPFEGRRPLGMRQSQENTTSPSVGVLRHTSVGLELNRTVEARTQSEQPLPPLRITEWPTTTCLTTSQ
jgi:hypothetical protein